MGAPSPPAGGRPRRIRLRPRANRPRPARTEPDDPRRHGVLTFQASFRTGCQPVTASEPLIVTLSPGAARYTMRWSAAVPPRGGLIHSRYTPAWTVMVSPARAARAEGDGATAEREDGQPGEQVGEDDPCPGSHHAHPEVPSKSSGGSWIPRMARISPVGSLKAKMNCSLATGVAASSPRSCWRSRSTSVR